MPSEFVFMVIVVIVAIISVIAYLYVGQPKIWWVGIIMATATCLGVWGYLLIIDPAGNNSLGKAFLISYIVVMFLTLPFLIYKAATKE